MIARLGEVFANRWEVESEGIRVHGTKSSAAERVVPRVGILVKPATKRQAFYTALRIASVETVAPYDLRRSYAQWLDLARIPQFQQSYYGHGPRTWTSSISPCGLGSISGRTRRRSNSWSVRRWPCGW